MLTRRSTPHPRCHLGEGLRRVQPRFCRPSLGRDRHADRLRVFPASASGSQWA